MRPERLSGGVGGCEAMAQRCPPPPPRIAPPPPALNPPPTWPLNPPTWLAKETGRAALNDEAARKALGALTKPVRCGANVPNELIARVPEKPVFLPANVPNAEEWLGP